MTKGRIGGFARIGRKGDFAAVGRTEPWLKLWQRKMSVEMRI